MNSITSIFTRKADFRIDPQHMPGTAVTPPNVLEQADGQDTPHPDIALVAACLHGDASAWDELVDKYGRLVYWIAYRNTSSPDEADDVFQNVFAIVLKSLSQLRQEQSLATWLGTITRREAQRLGKQRKWVELNDSFEDPSDDPVEEIHRQFLREQVQLALLQLDSFSREFLLACMAEPPPSYTELAARFGMAVGSVGPTRGRCLTKLEAILKQIGIISLG